MRRFAKLTRDGFACYVDPALVGIVALDQKLVIDVTTFEFRTRISDRSGMVLMDRIDQPPSEVYRRLAAAGEVVTKAQFEEIADELRTVAWTAGTDLRAKLYTAVTPREAVDVLVAPIQAVYDKLKRTVLAALWVAEGENPNA